ncbi:hypothetical protein PRZ48_013887 [Zasmidium cellare]|uniref:Uncharacterized protein n=1 Tax=Zasmidium cellare TaxID=395010 RepID=A0ABR0E009_ZASCE|nr:hypothetical protein PRZ48_013887 [Zasmidium cellare]
MASVEYSNNSQAYFLLAAICCSFSQGVTLPVLDANLALQNSSSPEVESRLTAITKRQDEDWDIFGYKTSCGNTKTVTVNAGQEANGVSLPQSDRVGVNVSTGLDVYLLDV